jgi:asparagine synthase (glutamine-hydrolysing)
VCGIAILFHADDRPAAASNIEPMLRVLRHRGPDHMGQTLRGPCALGHTRLSIVDVRGGDQPMFAAGGDLAIVFNGEIYNYQTLRSELLQQGCVFHTHSDTEVILELYRIAGPRCVQRLRGMFAFAIHDSATGSLFLARDRLGIKPLFYAWDGRTLVAASEIKALFASGFVEAALDPSSIGNYFAVQHNITPYTPFLGVKELPPGTTMQCAPDATPKVVQYWDLEFPRDGEYESFDESFWLSRFGDALAHAAATHTIGEVPIGAYLSGGIDSSTMAWLLTEHYAERLRTFSIRFRDDNMDESALSRRTAQHLGVENVELLMDDARPEGFLKDLESCIYHLEQPQRLAVDIPHFRLSELVQSSGYKVVYTGDGADEILGGYDCYRQDYMRVWGNGIADGRRRRRQYFEDYTQQFAHSHIRMLWRLHRPRMQRRVRKEYGCYPAWYDFWQITQRQLRGLFTPDYVASMNARAQLSEAAAAMRPRLDGCHPLNQSLYIETKTRLPGWILWKSDRLSMAHGVEARVPFMDHPLVELAARIPPALKLNGMDEKYILKRVALPHLPEHPTQYKKRAFYTPIRQWFFTVNRQQEIQHYLGPQALRDTGMFEPGRVGSWLRQLASAEAPADMESYYRIMRLEWLLMTVLTVQILHQQFVGRKWLASGPGG